LGLTWRYQANALIEQRLDGSNISPVKRACSEWSAAGSEGERRWSGERACYETRQSHSAGSDLLTRSRLSITNPMPGGISDQGIRILHAPALIVFHL